MTMYEFSYELYDGVVGTELVNEEEPLFTVCLPSENDRALAWDEIDEAFVVVTRYLTEHRYELTENEIKRYDERYWAFAEPVEKEEF